MKFSDNKKVQWCLLLVTVSTFILNRLSGLRTKICVGFEATIIVTDIAVSQGKESIGN